MSINLVATIAHVRAHTQTHNRVFSIEQDEFPSDHVTYVKSGGRGWGGNYQKHRQSVQK